MSNHQTRRTLLASLSALAAAPAAAQPRRLGGLAGLERRGARLGVFVLDTGSGRTLAHRADERFLMASTFKVLEAAAVLHRVDRGLERLDRRVPFTAADLMANSPAVLPLLQRGHATVNELCAGMVSVSDNAAANLLLPSLGGPPGLTRWLRGIGDGVTRLDRDEPDLNRHVGDLDTTTPRAMTMTLRLLLTRGPLQPASRERLAQWMVETTTGPRRLRAGLPAGWRFGHKTGTSGEGHANDVGFVVPPGRAPIFISAYLQGARLASPAREAVLADVARLITAWAA